MDVSVIIPCLNSEATLGKCLESIRANRTALRYEIIVVDTGSTDHTLEIAGRYADKVLVGRHHIIDRNTGIEKATGRVICFTDSDCIVPDNWIERLFEGLMSLHQHDNMIVGVGGGNVPMLENPTPTELAITSAMRSPLISFKARNTSVYREGREVSHNPPMNSACFRCVLEEVGGFRQEPGYPEDLDIDARIIRNGYKLYYLPDLLVLHKHKNNLQAFVNQMYDFGVKRCRINREHKHIARFYHYGPLFLCLMLLSPFSFIPISMALLNAAFVSLKNRAFKLFFPMVRLTVDFYLYYGIGEIKAVVEAMK